MQEVKAAKKIEKWEKAQKSCRDHSLELIQKRPNWLLIFSFLTSVKKIHVYQESLLMNF